MTIQIYTGGTTSLKKIFSKGITMQITISSNVKLSNVFVRVFRIGLILVIFELTVLHAEANKQQSGTFPDSLSHLDGNNGSMNKAHVEKQNPISENPLHLPSNNERVTDDVNKVAGPESGKRRHGRKHHNGKSYDDTWKVRRHGHASRVGVKRSSCQFKTEYSSRTTANDIFGDVVDVAPFISFGGVTLKQYFYEQYCDDERCECRGTNKEKYRSSCETSHGYTLARTSKNGVTGWTYIKVRTGCHCIIEDGESDSKDIRDFLF